MKKWLIHGLICPECLQNCRDNEIMLNAEIKTDTDDDIVEGRLICPECNHTYDIHEGVAVIVPRKTLPITKDSTGYGSFSMLSSYLWSHYSEYFNGTDATDAYNKWAAAFSPQRGWSVDIGCAVGRLTFEMTKTHERAVGLDTSFSFIKAARELAAKKRLEFEMIMEGRITETISCDLDAGFQYDNAEFIVADAMALPFRSNRFTTASSVNILEKVPDPKIHLRETNRVLNKTKARFLFSDPFTWDESVNSPDLWIGGRNNGPFNGYGMDNLQALLKNGDEIFTPPMEILETGRLLWKIRKTRNLWEHITSLYTIAKRDLG